MLAEDFVKLVRRRPFVPMRLHLADGTTFDFRQPQRVMVSRQWAEVAIDVDPATGIVRRTEFLWLPNVREVEPIQPPDSDDFLSMTAWL